MIPRQAKTHHQILLAWVVEVMRHKNTPGSSARVPAAVQTLPAAWWGQKKLFIEGFFS
jgi:hypothetical protein